MKYYCAVHTIPLDAWVVILRFVDRQNLVHTFNCLFDANIFDIPEKNRIDTFWVVMSQARYLDTIEAMSKEMPVPEPNGTEIKSLYQKLVEMGVNSEKASDVLRQSNGDFVVTMQILGWN